MWSSSSPPSSIKQRGLLGLPCTGDLTLLRSTESIETSVHLTQLPSQGEMIVDCDRRRPPCCPLHLVHVHAISESSVDSLLTCRSTMSRSVSASRLFSRHTARNTSFVSRQMPPTTHCPSTNRLRLYFLFLQWIQKGAQYE